MKRRQVLRTLAVAGSVSGAGCSTGLVPGARGTILGRIHLINASFVANRVRLMVERDDETLLDRTVSLTAIDAETGPRGRIIEPLWTETRGQYTVRALHYDDSGNRESGDWEYTFTQDDYETYYGNSHEDPGCLGAVVTIGTRTETANGPIGIGPTYMETPCGASEAQ
jgi:hypothetical protein